MKNTRKEIIASVLIAITIAVAYGLPKPQYVGVEVLKKLSIPHEMPASRRINSVGRPGWKSKDMSQELGGSKDDKYNFISDIFARFYGRSDGNGLIFIALDAGNFHNPKICIGASGYKPIDLEDVPLAVGDKTLKAKAVLFEGGEQDLLVIYWMVINGKQVDWTGQKLQEFWHTLIGKKKAGIMARMDIQVRGDDVSGGVKLGQAFIRDLYSTLEPSAQDLLFGQE